MGTGASKERVQSEEERYARQGQRNYLGVRESKEKVRSVEWGHLSLPLPLDLNGWVAFLFFLPLMLGVGFSITASNFWFPDTPLPHGCLPVVCLRLLNSLSRPLLRTMRGPTLQLCLFSKAVL